MSEGDLKAWHFATRQPVRVCWRDGIISRLEPTASAPEQVWLAPSLFDVQVNGFGGVDFQQEDMTEEDLLSAIKQLRAAGCARFLLTLITDDWDRLMARLRHLRQLRSQSACLQRSIAGWHIEGPFLSAELGFSGTHNPTVMCDPTRERLRELRAITGVDPLLLTLAPERPNALAVIALAVSMGIKVSLGHTNASSEILQQAVRAGAVGFTHLGNGCPQMLDRHDNILWRVLETPGLRVSLIPDRIHVSPPFFRLAHRLLRSESVYYTTDAMAAAGAPPGRYKLGAMELEVGPDQIVRRPGQPYLAGSALRPIDGITRAAAMLNCDWQEVWPRLSETPAKLMGLSNEIAVGSPAEFCCLKVSDAGRVLEIQNAAG